MCLSTCLRRRRSTERCISRCLSAGAFGCKVLEHLIEFEASYRNNQMQTGSASQSITACRPVTGCLNRSLLDLSLDGNPAPYSLPGGGPCYSPDQRTTALPFTGRFGFWRDPWWSDGVHGLHARQCMHAGNGSGLIYLSQSA